jgi:MFS family permease
MDLFFYAIYFGNLVNYVDRGLVSTLLPTLKNDFQLSEIEQGVLSSSFIVGYAVCCVIFSVLSSRKDKITLLTIGSLIWSCSCLMIASSTQKWSLYIARCLSGVGEAAYQSIVPSLFTDIYGEKRGWRRNSIFFTAINIGTSLGLLIGGVVRPWRYIYLGELLCGVCLVLLIHNLELPTPPADENTETHSRDEDNTVSCDVTDTTPDQDHAQDYHSMSESTVISTRTEWQKIVTTVTTPEWQFATFGSMLISYSSGVLSLWMPSYFKQTYGDIIPYDTLSALLCMSLLVSGTIGSLVGDRLAKRVAGRDFSDRTKLLKLCCYGCLIAIPFSNLSVGVNWGLFFSVTNLSLCLMAFAFLNIINGMITVTCTPSDCRSYSVSLNILILHLGGDMPSPIISSAIWQATNNLREAILISLVSLWGAVALYFFAFRKMNNRDQLNKTQMHIDTTHLQEL